MPNLKSFILDTFFPRRCLGCDIPLTDETGHYICRTCLNRIKFQNTFACAFCGSPVSQGITCPYCRKGHFLDQLLVVTSYENLIVGRIIKSMKYRFVKTLAKQLGNLMAGYLKKRISRGFVLENIIAAPVPLHSYRLRWRGFNHAEIMANAVGFEFGLEVVADALSRVRGNKPQADMLDLRSRIANMKTGTFRCVDPSVINGQRVLLIDDISTTGSTLDDCARALKGAGAKEVIGFVFARGKLAKHRKFA